MSKYTSFKLKPLNLSDLLASSLLLFATTNAFADIHIAQKAEVESCHYLAEIEGNSGYGKNQNWQSLAKNSVLTQAENMAATHVIWMQFTPVGGFNGIAVAQAYSCPLAP